LPDRHARDDLIDQVCGALRHAPRAARGAKPAPLAGKRHQLLVCADSTAHTQKSVRQNAAFEKGLELVVDKLSVDEEMFSPQVGIDELDRPGVRASSRNCAPYSHSMVAGGLDEMS
jgi:hypothetical protein